MVRIPAHIASPPTAMANPAPMNIEDFPAAWCTLAPTGSVMSGDAQ
jgi:hypothetical protein